MFRRVCNLCKLTNTKKIHNIQRCITNINMFPTGVDDEVQIKSKQIEKSKPIIVCKRKEFNHYPGTDYSKSDDIPIASKGWHHFKSKGDYFTINPIIEDDGDDDDEHKYNKFDDFNINSRLIENIKNRGVHQPTIIQQRGIPAILDGKNTIITAETGCGKTLTYLIPIINQILKWKAAIIEDKRLNSPLAVIITPSRELVLQIGKEAKILTNGLNIDIKTLTGGRTKKLMRTPSLRNVDILIGTLGVTSKLTAVRMYKLNYVRYTVIDEAHALFDQSFDEKMEVFLRRINFGFKQSTKLVPQSSQLMLVSATMPEKLPEYLSNSVNLESLVNVTTNNCHRVLVPQKFLRLGKIQKPATLLKLIKSTASRKVQTIVFSNSSTTSDWISIFLNHMNINAVSLNSDMSMVFRKDKYRQFDNGEVYVLSTTNAGARGLDTVSVEYIINYDFPFNTADYVHRCGRTGRIGSSTNGRVINFISEPLEIELVKKIERATRRNRPLPMFDIKEQKYEKLMDEELKSLINNGKSV